MGNGGGEMMDKGLMLCPKGHPIYEIDEQTASCKCGYGWGGSNLKKVTGGYNETCEIFPEDLYSTRKMTFGKIKYLPRKCFMIELYY